MCPLSYQFCPYCGTQCAIDSFAPTQMVREVEQYFLVNQKNAYRGKRGSEGTYLGLIRKLHKSCQKKGFRSIHDRWTHCPIFRRNMAEKNWGDASVKLADESARPAS